MCGEVTDRCSGKWFEDEDGCPRRPIPDTGAPAAHRQSSNPHSCSAAAFRFILNCAFPGSLGMIVLHAALCGKQLYLWGETPPEEHSQK